MRPRNARCRPRLDTRGDEPALIADLARFLAVSPRSAARRTTFPPPRTAYDAISIASSRTSTDAPATLGVAHAFRRPAKCAAEPCPVVVQLHGARPGRASRRA